MHSHPYPKLYWDENGVEHAVTDAESEQAAIDQGWSETQTKPAHDRAARVHEARKTAPGYLPDQEINARVD